MSKVDAQRAMREAKYARNQANRPSRPQPAAGEQPPATRAARPAKPEPAAATDEGAPETGGPETAGRCGHKSMNGRVCIRPAAHAEKSHRYG
jgi:hypothetical protein